MNGAQFSALIRRRTLQSVSRYVLGVTAYALLAVYVETRTRYHLYIEMPADLHAAFALVLGWLLVFRTNTAYDRWWEARKLWGGLVNVSRNLAIKACDLCPTQTAEQAEFCTSIVAFSYALKDHLREGATLQALPGFADAKDEPEHVPGYLMTRIYRQIREWKAAGRIDGDELRVLDADARQFLDICGGCERIRKTLVVRSYRRFARQCVGLYLVTFPWGIVDSFRLWTVPLTAIVTYFMLGLEIVAEHVEEPFGYDEDDLDLERLCDTIHVTVTEIQQRSADGTPQRSPA